MTAPTKFWISSVEYRPDPANPDAHKVLLGLVFECVYKATWYVGTLARVSLSDDELKLMDGIGRDLYREPCEAISREVRGSLSRKPEKPGGVLAALHSRLVWSLHVTEPGMERKVVPARLGAMEAAFEAALTPVFHERLGISTARPARRTSKKSAAVKPLLLPPWVTPAHIIAHTPALGR